MDGSAPWHPHGPAVGVPPALRAIISHETIEQTRYKTREGMKTAVSKGKAAGGIAYGYRMKFEHDDKFNRIAGLREIDEEQAQIVRWIFEQYALGRSPQEMAIELNNRDPSVPGPRGALWRDTAIRGHRDRRTGILNNEAYVGRLVFNRRNFRKNPETEQREARMNDRSEWVIAEVPELRIIDDELWTKVKKWQLDVGLASSKPIPTGSTEPIGQSIYSSDGKAAELSIIGRLASILASMRAFQEYSAGLREQRANEFARRVRADEFKDRAEKMDYLHRFEAVLAEEEASWRRLQISVVAGAGFHLNLRSSPAPNATFESIATAHRIGLFRAAA
ncbi:recombinase family protein [Agrobacterium pusense]|uniref:recombinase family protein n=1 Tax=Agrobacterium pusense TaxID=648995 RepID=UPI0035A67C5C